MSHPATDEQILARVLALGLADPDDLPEPRPAAADCLAQLVVQGRLTEQRLADLRAQAAAATPTVQPPSKELGSLGPYKLIAELGRGGMGVVFKAEDVRLRRTVAVKTLVAGEHASPELVARFVREAQAAAKLGTHPHIVPVLDVGQEGTRHYIVMELVDGDSLETMIDEGAIPVRHAARYAAKTARAVQHAHDHGIYHRDLKPANVMVGRDNEPRLTDFGLARIADAEQRLTQSGALIGTPHYMAPEQVQGAYDAIDHRTDVYGLGAILYELLTDAPPFGGGGTPEIIRKVMIEPPRAPRRANPGVPRDLETICLKALEKPKERRYQSAGEFADDLDRWLKGEPIAASPVSGVSRMVRWARRKPLAAATLGLAAVALVFAGLLGWTVWQAARTWDGQVQDARLDIRYERFDDARGKLQALLKERPADPGLVQLLAATEVGQVEQKAREQAELEAFLRDQLQRRYLAKAQAALTRLRASFVTARGLRTELLTAQAEMRRLNAGGEPPAGSDLQAYFLSIKHAHTRAGVDFFGAINDEVALSFGAFLSAVESAMAEDAPGAAELCFTGLLERIVLAREYGDAGLSRRLQVRLEQMLAAWPALRPPLRGTLRMPVEPATAEVWIARSEAENGVRQAGVFTRRPGAPPAPTEHEQWLYVVELRAPGYATARLPVWIRDGEEAGPSRPIRLLREADLGETLVYIPRGLTYFGVPSGSQERWFHEAREIPGFLIGREEISMVEYAEFLQAMHDDGKPVEALEPMHTYPPDYRPLIWTGSDATLRVVPVPGLEDAPAMGVTRHQAQLYLAWRSGRDGRPYRLPTEEEWVRAARGGDLRQYPWGSAFSARFCVHEGWFQLDPRPPTRARQAPEDVSPFGVHDMAGSVQEWVSSFYEARNNSFQVRGGSWSAGQGAAAVTQRHRVGEDVVTLDFGFRLAADLPPK